MERWLEPGVQIQESGIQLLPGLNAVWQSLLLPCLICELSCSCFLGISREHKGLGSISGPVSMQMNTSGQKRLLSCWLPTAALCEWSFSRQHPCHSDTTQFSSHRFVWALSCVIELITLSAVQFMSFLFSKGFSSPLPLLASPSFKLQEVADSTQCALMLSSTRMDNFGRFNLYIPFQSFSLLIDDSSNRCVHKEKVTVLSKQGI